MSMKTIRLMALVAALMIAAPGAAQDIPADPDVPLRPKETRLAEPVIAGQRQSSDQIASKAGITPMGRVAGRVENRVQSRMNNRLDRSYRTSEPPAPGEQVRRARDSARR